MAGGGAGFLREEGKKLCCGGQMAFHVEVSGDLEDMATTMRVHLQSSQSPLPHQKSSGLEGSNKGSSIYCRLWRELM